MIKMELQWHHRLARGTYTKYDKVEKPQGPTSLVMIMESTGKLKASFLNDDSNTGHGQRQMLSLC